MNPPPSLAAVLARHPALRLLVLFGSRARDEASEQSDWDLAYLGEVDADALAAELARALSTDRIDVVKLDQATGLLRYHVARDGQPLLDTDGAWQAFVLQSTLFWCDVQPVLDRAYDQALAQVKP